jgi:hypothetical protein
VHLHPDPRLGTRDVTQSVANAPGAKRALRLGLFIDPWTYRVIGTIRSWLGDLLVVGLVTAAAVMLELAFGHARIPSANIAGASEITHTALLLRAQVWYPAVIAGVALLACLRLRAHVGIEPSIRRLVTFVIAGVAIFSVAALELNACPGAWWTRFGALLAAAVTLRAVLRWRARTPLRMPTAAGIRPPLRVLLTPRGFRALANLRVSIPAGGIITTDGVDRAVAAVVRSCSGRGNGATEAYAYARAVEHALARGRFVEAEATLSSAHANGRLSEQPALACAQVMLLHAVGSHDDALELLEGTVRRMRRKPPPALRSLLASLRLQAERSALATGGAEPEGRTTGDWTRLAYRGRPGAILVELAGRIEAASRESPDTAVRAAHRVLEIANAFHAHPLIPLGLDEIERVEEARGHALLAIARICESAHSWQDATSAYLDAVNAFMFVKDRAHTAECFVRASALMLTYAKGSPGQESHALDIMRAGLEVSESERGGLRRGASRLEWARSQRSLFDVAFRALATDLRWHPEKGAELGLWLIESLHRTTLAAAARSRLALSDVELQVRLEELARAEAAQAGASALPGLAAASQKGAVPSAEAVEAASRARAAVIAQFTTARDGSLSVDPVNVETLRARLGAGVALLYGCARDSAGWRVNCVLVHREREHVFRGLIENGGEGSPCGLLDAIAEKHHEAVARAFAAPMWDEPWPELTSQILPPQLTNVLQNAEAETRDLVVVPDGPLAAVPFAGLKLRDGRCLLEATRIRIVPSLSLIEEQRKDAEEPQRATVAVTYFDADRKTASGRLRMDPFATERVTDDRATLEAALRADPPADLAVILAHGHPGSSPFEAAVRLKDSAMSAAAALQLPWPPTVLLGSCWLGGGDVGVGEEPFGFPIACLMNGARTVVGALSPVPRHDVIAMLARVATKLPSAATLGDTVRRATLPTPGELEAWRDVSAMEWPCMTTWSTVAIAQGPCEERPASWDDHGLPRPAPNKQDRGDEVRMSRPPSPAAGMILELEQQRSRRSTVGLAGLMRGICSSDPDCSTLAGADALAAVASAGPIDVELPDRVLRLQAHNLPIYLSTGVATALEIAETMALELGLDEVPSPLLALAATFDERMSQLIADEPRIAAFVDGLTDLLERQHQISLLVSNRPSYDERLTARMQSQPHRPPSNALRIARRVGWGVAFLLLALIGSGLSKVDKLQDSLDGPGFLGVRLELAPGGSPEVMEVLPGTAAAQAGLHPGDEIEAVDGVPVTTPQEAQLRIGNRRPGQTVQLVALRHGSRLNLIARLCRCRDTFVAAAQGVAVSGNPRASPARERATATDSARTYARAAASMMSGETLWPAPVKPSTSSTIETSPSASCPSVTAPIVNSLSFAAIPVAALIAWNTASIGPSPVNEPLEFPPSGRSTETFA